MSKELATKKDLPLAQEITPMTMLNMLVQQGAEPDKLAQMMELQERWEANNARKAYVAAINEFRSNPPDIYKDKKVSFDTQKGKTEYSHAKLDSVTKILGEALSKYGLSYAWKTEQGEGGVVKVTCIITHVLGHSESTSLQASPDQSGGKNNIQAVGSTVSYLERYTLLALTGMATKDMDDDGNSAGIAKITQDQANEIHAKITDNKLDMDRFLKWLKTSLKCNSIEEINLNGYGVVINQINNSIKARAK